MNTIPSPGLNVDIRWYFFFLCALQMLFIIAFHDLILYDHLYFEAFGEQMEYERIQKILDYKAEYKWLSYVMIPVGLLLKITLVACCLNIGVLIERIDIPFSTLFRVSVLAETVYLGNLLLKILYFLWIDTDYTLQELNNFNPFSLLSLFDRSTLDFWQIGLLNIFNLFGLLYFLILVYQMKSLMQNSFSKSLGFVGSSYGAGLLLWLFFLLFLQLLLLK